MMSSGSMVFFFDFDIFSMLPILSGSPVAVSFAVRAPPSAPSIVTSAGVTHSPFALA